MRSAIADTCFLINWLRFRRRNDIFKLYRSVGVPILVLDELGRSRRLLAEWLASGKVFLVPRIGIFEMEALRAIEYAEVRGLPRVDPGEAFCLAVAKHRGYDVLTDNRAIKALVSEVEEYRTVRVLDSLDLLVAIYGREISSLRRAIAEYSSDTGLVFSPKRLREYGLA